MKTSWLLIAGLAAIWLSGVVASAQTLTPTVVYPYQVAISGPLSQGQGDDDHGNKEHKARQFHPIPHRGGGGPDNIRQATDGPPLNTDGGFNFPGIGANGFAPPDTNMAVGPNHILQTVNSRYAIYNKSGTLIAGPFSLNSIWASLGSGNSCATSNDGDVVAQYDKLADRFLITQLGSTTAPFSECIAVSQTSDPAGAYWLYSYAFGNQLNDYPKFGIWPTATNSAYLATYNFFADAQTFTGGGLCAYDRAKMLEGDPTAQGICYTVNGDGGYLPADLDGSTSPLDGTPGYFLNYETTSSLRMYALSPNFSDPSASTLAVAGPDVPVATFSEACAPTYTCIPQQGTNQKLDSIGDRLMYRLAFRNFGDHEAFVVNHSVVSGSTVGVRWYELRSPVSTSGQFSLYQQGTYAPDTTTYRWMGSAAMDSSGDIGLGYSVSSGSMRPGIRYTGRMPSDPLGTMESEVTMVTGNGSQTQGLNRWGDYSAMRIDPSDDCTFWYTNQYLVSNGSYNWQTAFGSFKFASCHPPDISLSASPSSVTVSQSNSGFSTITVTALNGFSGSVGLTVSGCPANTTCTVSTPVFPSPTATSVLDVFTTASSSIGTFTLTITGTTANSVVSMAVSLTVNPPPNFSISTNPPSVTLVQVGTATPAVTVTALYGFSGSVDLAVTGCPSGATCTLPTPVSPTGTSTLTVALSTGTSTGTYTLTITGTQGALIHTWPLTLTVIPAGTLTNVALAANGAAAVASSTYSSTYAAANAIDGDRKSDVYWNDATSNSFPDWLEVDFSGTKILNEIDVFSAQDNLQSPSDPTPTMAFTLYGLTNFEVQYWTGSAWADIPGGAVTNNNLVWRQFKFALLSTTKIRVFVTGTKDGIYSRIAEVEAYAIPNSPDFSILASPSSLTLVQGQTGTSSVTATALNGFSGSVDLAVTGCPAGATCSLPTPVSPTAASTLTITTSASTVTGTFTVTISGTQAAVIHTAAVALTVNAPGTLTNVALPANGGAAVASSTFSSADAAANAIDGDRKSDVFWNDATSNSFPDWLEVDFSGMKVLNEVDVFSVQDNLQSPVNPTPTMTFTLYGLTNFEVQYWTGSAWADIPGGAVTNNNLVWRQFKFAPLPTTKIRVFVTGTKDGIYSRIAEVEAYAAVSSVPDFLISANPSSLSLVQAGTGTSDMTVTALNGFSGSVDLAVTGCPSGATCTLSTPVSPTGTSTLTVALSTGTSTGTYTLTITGTQGALIHTWPLTLTVIPAGTLTNVALAANGAAAVASSTYSSTYAAANAIDGDRKSDVYWNDATSNSFPDWLEVDFSGTKILNEIDVFSAQDNLQSPSDPTPTMAFTLYGLTNFEVQYWTGSAWADIPGGAVTNNNLVWRQFKFASLPTTKIRVFVTGTKDGIYSRIAEVEAYAIPNSPDFSILASPSSLTLVQGQTGTSSVTATALNGFSGSVDLAVTGCPAGATCSLPTPVSPTAASTLTITTSASTVTGTFTVTISGTQAAVIHTAAVALTVNAPGTLTNVALPANGGAAVASSTFSSADAAANAIDGDRKSDVFWNDATSNSFPDWLEVDFSGMKVLNEVDVFSVQDNLQSPVNPTPTMTFTLYGLTNFEVQYWTGSAWADIPGGAVTNNNLVWRQFKFAPLPTTKIRVFVTGTKDGIYSRIAEVEAYAAVSSVPDFLISANPSSLSLVQAGTGTSDMTVTALNGFSGSVDLAVTGCPSGATCTLSTPVSPTATSTLTVALSTGTSTGTYTLTITGTQGALIHTVTLTLTVIPAGTLTNVALAANGGAAVASSTYSNAYAAANAIDGDRKSDVYWNDGTSNSFPDWLEVDFSGTKILSEIDVFSAQDNLQSPVNPTPTMTFTLYGLTNFEVQYWTGSAWADIPGGAVTNNNLVWRQFKFAPLSTTKIRVFVSGTKDGIWSRIAEVEAYAVPNSPDFSISASPSSLTLAQGDTGTSSVTATALNGFSGSVDLAVTGCPAGATCSLPTPVSPTAASTLTITTSASTGTGTFTVTISGTQAAVTHTAAVALTVNAP